MRITTNQTWLCTTLGLGVLALAAPARAFDPPIGAAGPITATIVGAGEIAITGTEIAYEVKIDSTSGEAIEGRVALSGIDGWTANPVGPVPFSVAARSTTSVSFKIRPSEQTLNAHYPIHAHVDFRSDGQPMTAHAILVVQARNEKRPHPFGPPIPWQPVDVGADNRLSLLGLTVRRPMIASPGQPPLAMPAEWQGSEPTTLASIDYRSRPNRGYERAAISMHPPYRDGRKGVTAVQYPLRLPADVPIRLRFAVAIRDHDPAREPPSDGVTFRVRVMPFSEAVESAAGEVLFEKHTAAKQWEAVEVELSAYAGKAMILQLESDPGPRQDTTCDSCYWAEPVLLTGPQALGQASATAAFPPGPDTPPRRLGALHGSGGPWRVQLWPGRRGLLDAAIGFETVQRELLFRGFGVRVNGVDLQAADTQTMLTATREEPVENGCRMRHQFRDAHGTFDLLIELSIHEQALRAKVWLENTPGPLPWRVTRLEDVSCGEWTRAVRRVYAGTGNVIEEPEAFELGFDGHRLAASYVGYDFDNGASMVQAVDAIPHALRVRPGERHYSLHSPHAQTLFFIPAANVWDGVRAWREINGLQAAPGVKQLAGRFVFDWWGGDYAGSARALERSFRYGLTHSVVVWHNWQRFGYDNRLPDIFPPNPKYGTMEEFKALAELCKQHGVLFAPHDNYIDYYPDAEGFSYEHIAFNEQGEPVKAWYNPGPKAQSYRWRADRIRPLVERNVKLLQAQVPSTAYFIDVFSSIEPYDYWTRDGGFHDRRHTNAIWGEIFDWIRDFQGRSAPQISESGHDALIGRLDGAQCNHLRVGSPPEGAGDDRWFLWDIRCKDAERVPWFDAAHHDRFVLHGAGYEGRFRAGLDRRQHGMYSDDYISVEVLDGHPGMAGQPFGRDVVRKYWLLNDFMTALAGARIESVEFADENPHRQHVIWRTPDGRAEVWVNRDTSAGAWIVGSRKLPPYGFYARAETGAGTFEAAVEGSGEHRLEWSRSPTVRYVNARRGEHDSEAARREDPLLLEGIGELATNGAVRLDREPGADGRLRITPLPDEPARKVLISFKNWPAGLPAMTPRSVEVLDEQGRVLRSGQIARLDDVYTFTTRPGEFAYRLLP